MFVLSRRADFAEDPDPPAAQDPDILRTEKKNLPKRYEAMLEGLINQRLLQLQLASWDSASLESLFEQRAKLLKSPDFMQRTYLVPILEGIIVARHRVRHKRLLCRSVRSR